MCLWWYFDWVLSYKPISPVCVMQLAGVGGASEHGWARQPEQQPAEEKATMAQTGHPDHPADARRHACAHAGKKTQESDTSQNTVSEDYHVFYLHILMHHVFVCVTAGEAPAQCQHAGGKPSDLHGCLGNFQQLPQTSSGETALLHTVYQEVRDTSVLSADVLQLLISSSMSSAFLFQQFSPADKSLIELI